MPSGYGFCFALRRNFQFGDAAQSDDALKSCRLVSKSSRWINLRGSLSNAFLVDKLI
jgi:hypothetical protein